MKVVRKLGKVIKKYMLAKPDLDDAGVKPVPWPEG